MLDVAHLKTEIKIEPFNAACYNRPEARASVQKVDSSVSSSLSSSASTRTIGFHLATPSISTYNSWIPRPVLQNIVSTVNLGTPLKLHEIAQHARNIEYNPRRFGAAVLRIRSPRTTALLFASGKMVITGAKTQEQSREAGRKFARIVQKLGFKAKFNNFKVQNIVACANVNFMIRLEGVATIHHQFCTYEPELFPGIVYRMVKPRVVLLIFSTGKVVITGAQNEESIAQAFAQIYPLLQMFIKRD
ncbi:hypothetical protein QR680_011307 [Steinernema hermaphroditum]|uniref:TATA-box-binding protein n=1 Tax=Steinernema hermaphroditum TaxID=289476 RepID=A0AA39MD00_9BILA|nr:hypothetical protein QR680_011307 [Steinernema hermaphroditum]